jgi:hypothetical protein
MDVIRSLIQLAPPYLYGNWIMFHGKRYPVCGPALEFFSEVFAKHRTTARDSPYEIKSHVCEESVIEFLKPFQNQGYNVTPSNAYDILTLCEEFSIECYQQTVVDFIDQNNQGAIIEGIKRSLERNSISSHLEAKLHERFFEFLDKEDLFELPINCLIRVAALPPSPTHDQLDKFVNLIIKSLDHYGSAASILLTSVDFNQLAFSQINRLMERNDVIWGYLGNFSMLSLLGCLNEHSKLHEQIELAQVERTSLNQRVTSVSVGFDEKLAKLEAKIESLGKDYAQKTDLEKFRCDSATKSQFDYVKNTISLRTFSFKPACPLNGVISHLNREYGGNPLDLNIIEVTSSSQYDQTGNCSPRHATILDTKAIFHSDCNTSDQWISYNFRSMRLSATHYSILTRGDCDTHHGPKSWKFEISNDGQNWVPIDQRTDDQQLNGRGKCGTFQISQPTESQFIRLHQTARLITAIITWCSLLLNFLERFDFSKPGFGFLLRLLLAVLEEIQFIDLSAPCKLLLPPQRPTCALMKSSYVSSSHLGRKTSSDGHFRTLFSVR